MAIDVGSILEGKVTGITRFGAFVQLENGETGLVHISEVADVYVKDVSDFVKENDTVRVKVLNVSPGKIGLSIRQADPNYQERSRAPRSKSNSISFEEKLAKFMKDSEEKQTDLRRSQDSNGAVAERERELSISFRQSRAFGAESVRASDGLHGLLPAVISLGVSVSACTDNCNSQVVKVNATVRLHFFFS